MSAKEPAKRYPSARALAEDLSRFQSGHPIEARPVGRLERGVKWARRHPALAALLAVSAALLVALLGGGWVAALQQSQSNQALQAVNRANRQALVRLNVTNGRNYLEDDDLFGSLIWFTRALKLEEDEDRLPAHRTRLAAVLRQCPRLGQLWFHDEDVTAVAFSPDGRWSRRPATTARRASGRGHRKAPLRQPLRHDAPSSAPPSAATGAAS
jgi:hypothetical protein